MTIQVIFHDFFYGGCRPHWEPSSARIHDDDVRRPFDPFDEYKLYEQFVEIFSYLSDK